MCIISKPLVNSNSPETLNSGPKLAIFCPVWPWNLTDDIQKNNKAPPLYYIKLCASFQSHQWIQTGVTVPKHYLGQNQWFFLSHVTLKFDGWPWKTIGHLFYATSSFLHHLIAISELKKTKTRVIVWKCPIRIKIDDFFVPCDLEIWQMTLKSNREPLLHYCKLCGSFWGHM